MGGAWIPTGRRQRGRRTPGGGTAVNGVARGPRRGIRQALCERVSVPPPPPFLLHYAAPRCTALHACGGRDAFGEGGVSNNQHECGVCLSPRVLVHFARTAATSATACRQRRVGMSLLCPSMCPPSSTWTRRMPPSRSSLTSQRTLTRARPPRALGRRGRRTSRGTTCGAIQGPGWVGGGGGGSGRPWPQSLYHPYCGVHAPAQQWQCLCVSVSVCECVCVSPCPSVNRGDL
jgi:hypothetical protein